MDISVYEAKTHSAGWHQSNSRPSWPQQPVWLP